MEEDVAGTRAAGTGRSYAECLLCGRVFARRVVVTAPAGPPMGARSEYAEICPDCEEQERRENRPIVLDDEP